ncbi:MAG: hypothetical protein GXP08_16605 [Gammaproteobacteria bacterium]|nr:hypothetical protein [Gammaproteobacteria bacterium]
MNKFSRQLMIGVMSIGLIAPAYATNGYFGHGYGTKNKALAGAGVALPQDAMAAATNPAGMVFVGDRMDIGAALFSPRRKYSTDNNVGSNALFAFTPETVESDNEYFLIPHFAKNWMLSTKSSAGITVYGNGGMNTDYPLSANGGQGSFGGGKGAGIDLSQLFVNLSYAHKIGQSSALGAGVILAYQQFEATGLAAFGSAGFNVSSRPDKLSDNGKDSSAGYGFKLGWQSELSPGLTLAASYQSETIMDEFDDYSGLFAEDGGFDIPATWSIGLAYMVNPLSTFVLDIQKIMYSDIRSIANPVMPALLQCYPGAGGGNDSTKCLGSDAGSGFGWEDMTIVKVGYQWQANADWVWRVGYSKGDQPIPNSEVLFNILAPAVIEEHVTFGFTTFVGSGSEINFSFMYALNNEVTGPNPLGDGQQVTLEMDQIELEASYGIMF